MDVNVIGGKLSQKEINTYITHAKQNNPNKEIPAIEITVDGDFVDVKYCFNEIPFERIRRITGYLVGTTDRWNNAKRAEEQDRVKHGMCSCS
ncbi:MAG: anaerobic ribonucleoside-triphosphate reductase [Bacillota bacterium]|nr:anaerobic ribonucleoside-triphosphate reductase [Bacillota bacterium]